MADFFDTSSTGGECVGSSPLEKLRRCWESFLHTGREKKEGHQYLNHFLKMYLEERSSNIDGESLQFSDMKSVSNILAREFLSDVHMCCSQSKDDDDASGLTSYLLSNRGWMILKVLSFTGVQSLTCNKELGELLISLLRLCSQTPMKDEVKRADCELQTFESYFTNLPQKRDDRLFSSTTSRKLTSVSSLGAKRLETFSSRQRSAQYRYSREESDSDSGSEDMTFPFVKSLSRVSARRQSSDGGVVKSFKTLAGEFGFFPQILKKKENSSVCLTIQDLGNIEEIAAFDMCVLMIELICAIGMGDMDAHLSKSLPAVLLPGLLEFLRSLNEPEDSKLANGWTNDDVILLEQHLIRVIVVISFVMCQAQNGYQALFTYEVIPMLLEVGRVCMENLGCGDASPDCTNGSATKPTLGSPYLYLLGDILEGNLLLMQKLMNAIPPNPSSLKNTVHLATSFMDHYGFDLIHNLVHHVDQKHKVKSNTAFMEDLYTLSRAVISGIGKVIISLKQLKVDYIHSMKCLKRKHVHCEFGKHLHHHHNILGLPFNMYDNYFSSSDSYGSLDGTYVSSPSSSADLTVQGTCSTATWCHFLFKIFPSIESKFLAREILGCVEVAGLCCCIQPDIVLTSLLENLESRSGAIRRYILKVTVWALLYQNGGSAAGDGLPEPCDFCYEQENHDRQMSDVSARSNSSVAKDTSSHRVKSSNNDTDSALSSSDTSVDGEKNAKHPKWRCLGMFQRYINSKNSAVGSQVTKYLLRLVNLGTIRMKQELFTTNFLPILTEGRQLIYDSEEKDDTNAKNVILHCLSALPILLQSRSAQHLFHGHGCLQHMVRLLEVPSLQTSVLKVFEVLIILDDEKLISQMKQSPFSNIFGKTLEKISQRKASWYDLGQRDLSISANESDHILLSRPKRNSQSTCYVATAIFFDVLHDVTQTHWRVSPASGSSGFKEFASRKFTKSREQLIQKDVNSESGSFESTSTLQADSLTLSHSVMESLSFVVSLWTSCEKLFMHSPTFQDAFIQCDGAGLAYQYLVETIQNLNTVIGKGKEDNSGDQSHTGNATGQNLDAVDPKTDNLDMPSSEWENFRAHHKEEVDLQETFRLRLSVLESLLLICLGCCGQNVPFGEQKFTSAQLMTNIHALLQNYAPKDVIGFKSLCMHLLHCATPRGTIEDMLKTNSYAFMHLKDDLHEESDGTHSDASDNYSSLADMTYDADGESGTSDSSYGNWRHSRHKLVRRSKELDNLILYPQICILVLELIIPMRNNPEYDPVVIHLLQKILHMAKENGQNCSALYGQGLVKVLLEGFKDVISSKEFEGQEKQTLLLEMFSMMAQQTFSSSELKSFLRLFLQETPAVSSLLTTFLNLTKSLSPQPTYILCFPVTSGFNRQFSSGSRSASVSSSPASGVTGGSYYVISHSEAYEIDESGMRRIKAEVPGHCAATKCSWTSCALQMPVSDQLSWPPTKKGFSLSLWLRLQDGGGEWRLRRIRRSGRGIVTKDSNSDSSDNEKFASSGPEHDVFRGSNEKQLNDSCLHVISVGSKELLFEIWADPGTGKLIVRLTGSTDNEVITECATTPFLRLGHWEHLCFNFNEMVEENTHYASVCLTLNGYHQKTVVLEYSIGPVSSSSTSVLLGHRLPKSEVVTYNSPGWQLGNVMLFRDCCLTKETIFHLFTLGPDCTTISQCGSGEQVPVYKYFINQELLDTQLVYEMLTGNQNVNLQMLRDNLVLTYTPNYHGTYNLYKQVGTKPILKEATRLPVPQILKPSKGPQVNPLLHQQPEMLSVGTTANIVPQVHKGILGAIDEIGGIGVFLFLYARIVEEFKDETNQAMSMKLLFQLIQQNPRFAKEFQDLGGYALLRKVLTTSNCCIGFASLKVLLDVCVSEPVLEFNETTESYDLNAETEAVIQDTEIIVHIFLAWKIWENVDTAVWIKGLKALELLIREDHPNREFNMRQMDAIGLIDKLLLICQERIQESYPSLPIPICERIVQLIQSMLGSPPDLNHLVTICDFLLLVHPAASTYVFHTTDTFYFNSKWADVVKEKYNEKVHDFTSSLPVRCSTPIRKTNSQNFKSQRTPVQIPEEGHKSLSAPSSPQLRNRTRTNSRSKHLKPLFIPNQSKPSDLISSDSGADTGETYLIIDSPQKESLPSLKKFDVLSSKSGCTGSLDDVPKAVDQDRQLRRSSSEGMSLATALEEYTDKEGMPLTKLDEVPEVHTDSPTELTGGNASHKIVINPADHLGWQLEDKIGIHKGSPLAWNERHFASDRSSSTSSFPSTEGLGSVAAIPVPPSNTNLDTEENELIYNLSPTKSEDWEMYVDSGTMQSIPVSIQPSPQPEDVVEDVEKGLVHVCSGLLKLLRDVVITLPDAVQKNVHGIILKPEILVVLAHHSASDIRVAVVKLLDAVFRSSTSSIVTSFLDIQGFHLLGSQLQQHAATRPLVEACLLLIFGQNHGLDEDIEPSQMMNVSPLQQRAVIPLISLLSKTVHDGVLCHNTLCILSQIFETIPTLAPFMLENGLVEAMCNTVIALNAFEESRSPVCDDGDPYQIVFGDVEYLLSMIAVREFNLNGVSHYQLFEDITIMLGALERAESEKYGVHSVPVARVRCIQCQILQAVIDVVCEKADKPCEAYLTQRRSTYVPPGLGKYQKDPGRRRSSALDLDLLMNLQQRAQKRREQKIGQSELLERTKKVVALAVDLVLFVDPVSIRWSVYNDRSATEGKEMSDSIVFHLQFARYFLEFLMKAILDGMEKKQQKTYWKTLTWQTKDVLRVQFGRLYVAMSSLESPIQQRLFALSLLAHEAKAKDIVKMCFTANISHGQKLVVFIHDLLTRHQMELNDSQIDQGILVTSLLKNCGFTPLSLNEPVNHEVRQTIEEDLDFWMIDNHKGKLAWEKKRNIVEQRIFHKLDQLAAKISGHAMEVTQSVVNTQNRERKKFIEHVKMAMTHGLQVKKSWQHLIQQLTHERAVWFMSDTYPKSWQLDPTEGPFRVRKRLQRCHLGIEARYLLQDHRAKLDAENHPPPLSYLFEDDPQTSDSAALIYRLHTNEKIHHTCRCTSVTASSETSGEMLIGEDSVYFVADEVIHDANYTQVLLGNNDLLSLTWPLEDIKEIHKRRYQLRDIAMEIFLTNGRTNLMAFDNTKERDQVYTHFDTVCLPNLIKMENLTAIRQLWVEGRMTNFEYLIHLNKLAGRTFNDLMQYPVFPFIISDYSNDVLDLEKAESYRHLSRPIAVQDANKEVKFIQNYQWLKQEYEKAQALGSEDLEFRTEPFHYGSHYSNSGTVLHFLVRLPPFTKMFLTYQDRSFDVPDRTFHSLETTWKLSSCESTTDVKELIPEFFGLPEFLSNHEGFNFGHRQTGEQVNDVTLPKWCRGDPRLFILVNRQALESLYTSHNLHHWIDLVFGFKQTGKAAVEAINVFHPSTYFGVDVDAIQDPVKRKAMATMIRTYGQTPKLLFESPHTPCQLGEAGSALDIFSQLLPLQGDKASADVADDTNGTWISPLATVSGLKWGNFVGSPDCAPPIPTWQQSHGTAVMTLVALPTGELFGLGPCSCLLTMYSKEKGVTTMNTVDCIWAGILSWRHSDGILRLKSKKQQPTVNFIHRHGAEQVTCCASAPDCRLLFIGGTSGVISVYKTKYKLEKQCDLGVVGTRQCLYGHTGSVMALALSKPYSIMVSTGEDATCIIWDLNRMSYVRSITDHKMPVRHVSISDTLGDIATVSHIGIGSCLMLHTINAEHVATRLTDELINCVGYSNLPEGRYVNVIATGLSTGIVRLWSSWDLTAVRDIIVDSLPKQVCSLTYTHDGQKLLVSLDDGKVVAFETPPSNKTKVNFIPVL